MKNQIFILFTILICHDISGQTLKIWTGAVSNNWGTNANWNPSGVPNPNSEVYIGENSNVVLEPGNINGVNRTAFNITIEAGSSLTVNGDLDLNFNNIMSNSSIIQNNGTLTINDIVTVAGAESGSGTPHGINNSGIIKVNALVQVGQFNATGLDIDGNGILNTGTININSTIAFSIFSSFTIW